MSIYPCNSLVTCYFCVRGWCGGDWCGGAGVGNSVVWGDVRCVCGGAALTGEQHVCGGRVGNWSKVPHNTAGVYIISSTSGSFGTVTPVCYFVSYIFSHVLSPHDYQPKISHSALTQHHASYTPQRLFGNREQFLTIGSTTASNKSDHFVRSRSMAVETAAAQWDQPPMDSTAAKALEVAEMSRNLAETARAMAQQVTSIISINNEYQAATFLMTLHVVHASCTVHHLLGQTDTTLCVCTKTSRDDIVTCSCCHHTHRGHDG